MGKAITITVGDSYNIGDVIRLGDSNFVVVGVDEIDEVFDLHIRPIRDRWWTRLYAWALSKRKGSHA